VRAKNPYDKTSNYVLVVEQGLQSLFGEQLQQPIFKYWGVGG